MTQFLDYSDFPIAFLLPIFKDILGPIFFSNYSVLYDQLGNWGNRLCHHKKLSARLRLYVIYVRDVTESLK